MFGSNFFGNFGIPEQQQFPYQGADAQGGMFGATAPQVDPNSQGPGLQGPSQNAAPAGIPGTPGVSAGIPAPPQQLSPAAPSPLAGGPLAPGGVQPQTQPTAPEAGTAPAAGIGSPFGKAPNG